MKSPEQKLIPISRLLGQQLYLPDMHCPFPSGVHPDTSDVEEETLQWVIDFDLMKRGGRAEAALRALGPAEAFGRMCPTMDRETFLAASIWTAWIYLVDQWFCETGEFRGAPVDLALFHLWLREILNDPNGYDCVPICKQIAAKLPSEYAELCQKVGKATSDMAGRVEGAATPAMYARWVEGMTYFFLGTVWQVGLDVTKPAPSALQHIMGRDALTAAPAILALAAMGLPDEVPANDYLHVDVRRLLALATSIIGICNDVISFPRELGDIWNLPSVFMAQGMTPQEAVNKAVSVHNAKVCEYLALEERVRKWAGHELAGFLDVMGMLLRGSYEWHIRKERYAAAKNFCNVNPSA